MAPTYQQRVAAIPAALRVLCCLPCLPILGLGPYWWWSYSGLYRWLAEGQFALFGAFFPGYTGLFTLILALFAAMLPPAILFRILVSLNVFPVRSDASGPSEELGSNSADLWFQRNGAFLFWIGLGTMGLIGGGVLLFSGLSAGPLADIQLMDLEAGITPPSRRVRLQGRVLVEAAMGQKKGNFTTSYAPLVSERWRQGEAVAVYVRMSDSPGARKLPAPPWEGVLSLEGMPGPVRARFEEVGPRPAVEHYVFLEGERPEESVYGGLGLIAVSLGVLALTVFVLAMKIWRGA